MFTDNVYYGHVVFEILVSHSSVPNGDIVNIWIYESVTQKSGLGWR